MRPQGRYLRFRQVFPELFVPGVQARRGLLRLQWFLLHRIDFRPIWTLGALAGLGGVLLTVSLFFLQSLPQLAIAARVTPGPEMFLPEATVAPLIALEPPPLPLPSSPFSPSSFPPTPFPAQPSLPVVPANGGLTALPAFPELPDLGAKPGGGLMADWSWLKMSGWWDDRRKLTVVSEPQPVDGDSLETPPPGERWARKLLRSLPLNRAFSPYREPAGLDQFDPAAGSVAVADIVRSALGVVPASRPAAVVEKRIAAIDPGNPALKYQVVVTNPTSQTLPAVTVFEAVDVSRVAAVEPPAHVEPNGLRWRLGGLAPGERRELLVTYWTEGLIDLSATTEVELAERVSSVMQVERAVESPFYTREPEVPQPQPQPRPAPPPLSLPPFPVESDLPAFPAVNDLPPFPGPAPQTQPSPQTQPQPSAAPVIQGLPSFPTLPAEPSPAPPPAGRPILKLRADSPRAVAVGADATTWYLIENVGTAPAVDIVLVVTLPEGLEHHDGTRVVRYSIDRLGPGEKRRAKLITRVRREGVFQVAGVLQSGDQQESNLVQLVAPAGGNPPSSPADEPSRGDATRPPCRCDMSQTRLALGL